MKLKDLIERLLQFNQELEVQFLIPGELSGGQEMELGSVLDEDACGAPYVGIVAIELEYKR